MKSKILAEKIKISSFDELLGGSADTVMEVRLEELHEFQGHPFRVLDDEKMAETVESVRQHGILVPGIVRRRPEGGYEIISGHRRKRASMLAGKATMPVIVRHYTDDEATIIMVDSNIQREDLLPSEKAKAYRMKFDAMKHQGSRAGGCTIDLIGNESGESGKTVQRYIALSRLNDDLLQMVDEGMLMFVPGVDISQLNEEQQQWVLDAIKESGVSLSRQQSAFIKNNAKSGDLSPEMLKMLFAVEKPQPRRITLKQERLNQYFDENWNNDEIEELICGLLDEWKKRVGK